MKKKYTPYNFDEIIEYKIYTRIGKKHYKEFMHKKRRECKELLDFDKYTEWEKYFSTKYSNGDNNYNNFIHYLIQNYRMYQHTKELCKAFMIPMCIAIVSIMITIYITEKYSVEMLIGALFICVALVEVPCVVSFFSNQKKEDFYKDCIEVMNKTLTSHQS